MRDLDFVRMKDDLKANGFVVIPYELASKSNFFPALQRFHNSSTKIDESNGDYAGGCCNTYSKAFLENNIIKCIKNYNKLCETIIERMLPQESLKFVASYLTLDTNISSHIAQQPHFDRIPTIKFMLYLNDLTKKNGPFFLSPGSHIWVKEKFPKSKRPDFNSTEFFNSSRKIPDVYIEKLSPVYGQAGTIIVFDTDCIHHQGIVLNGDCRIIRSHFR